VVRKPIIFISGPFRGKPNIEWNRQQNIRAAEAAALFVWQHGGVAICPHKNTEHFDGACPDHTFLDGDLLILERCDAIWLINGWSLSEGACSEAAHACDVKKMLYSEQEVTRYIDDYAARQAEASPA